MERTAQSAKTESSAPARAETQKEDARLRRTSPKPKRQRPKSPGRKKAAAPRERNISRFVVFARDKGATVRLEGNAPLRYKSMNLTNPDRVVVDLDGQWQIKAPGVPKNPLVSNVRIGKMADKTRVVIDSRQNPKIPALCLPRTATPWTCGWISKLVFPFTAPKQSPSECSEGLCFFRRIHVLRAD